MRSGRHRLQLGSNMAQTRQNFGKQDGIDSTNFSKPTMYRASVIKVDLDPLFSEKIVIYLIRKSKIKYQIKFREQIILGAVNFKRKYLLSHSMATANLNKS